MSDDTSKRGILLESESPREARKRRKQEKKEQKLAKMSSAMELARPRIDKKSSSNSKSEPEGIGVVADEEIAEVLAHPDTVRADAPVTAADSESRSGAVRKRSEVRIARVARGSDQTDEHELQYIIEDADQSEEDEYEYVPITQVSQGPIVVIVALLREYYLIVAAVLIIAVCLLLSAIGRNASSVLIAIAFGALVLGGAYILYEAWKDKKTAEAEYRHAKRVMEPVRKKRREESSKEE